MIRASLLETMDEDYVRTARAKGASEWRVLRKHVLRNALMPVVAMLGMDMVVDLVDRRDLHRDRVRAARHRDSCSTER